MKSMSSLLLRTSVVAACALSGVSAWAQTTYEQDRAACMRSDSQHERTSCLREAGAVRAQGQNRAPGATPEARMENAMKRCADLPPENKSTCERMVHGEGTVSGSVAGGGQIRELDAPERRALRGDVGRRREAGVGVGIRRRPVAGPARPRRNHRLG